MTISRTFLAVSAGLAALVAAASAGAEDIVIHAGRLIDGVSKAPRSQVSILIHDDRITAVQDGFVDPAGARVIDLSNATVLPGLIDCHVHITSQSDGGDTVHEAVTRTVEDHAFLSTRYVRNTLEAGFTSVRDVGGETDLVVALKRAIAAGTIPGPRMWVAGAPLGPTGGHNDPADGLDPDLSHPHWTEVTIDSAEAARHAVRDYHRRGVDLIKIMPSGGVLSIGDDPSLQLMADDEIKAVVDTAHALHMKVAAHIHGTEAINHAVALGIDSVEHGSFADEESYRLMKEHGTYLVPTMLIGERVLETAREHPERLPPTAAAKAIAVVPTMQANFAKAVKAGVKVAFGTDESLVPHGENAKEFALMVKFGGMTPMAAIQAATSSAADLIGDTSDIGSVQPGRYADIIAVAGNPLDDVTRLEHVDFVMKGGVVYKKGGAPTMALLGSDKNDPGGQFDGL
jgi:imidazolonepropionase-like amidohydrolase